MHLQICTPPVANLSKIFHRGVWILNGVARWETSCKISFPNYKQIHVVQTQSFKMIYIMSVLLPYLGSKSDHFLEKFLLFSIGFEVFNEPYSFSFLLNHISFSFLATLATSRSFCENRSHSCYKVQYFIQLWPLSLQLLAVKRNKQVKMNNS